MSSNLSSIIRGAVVTRLGSQLHHLVLDIAMARSSEKVTAHNTVPGTGRLAWASDH